MSHEKNKKHVTCSLPPPISKGQHELLAKCLGKPDATIRKQYTRGKYNSYILDGQYNLEAIQSNLSKIFQPQSRHARKSQPVKKDATENKPKASKKTETKKQKPHSPPVDESEVKDYLDETIGELHSLGIDELWRRNELEKLLMARIKRKAAEGQLIDVGVVEREAFSAGLTIREGLESIADRCAPLVAATSDQFECREILAKEINHILNGMADALQISQ